MQEDNSYDSVIKGYQNFIQKSILYCQTQANSDLTSECYRQQSAVNDRKVLKTLLNEDLLRHRKW